MSQKKRILNPLTLVLLLSAAFFVIFLVVSGLLLASKTSTHKTVQVGGAFFGDGTVGVVEVNGVILDSKKTLRQLEAFEEDDDIRAVVMRLNSPGG